MSKQEFDVVYAEYVDTSGLFMSDDFEKRSYIHHLNARINYIKILLRLQREFISEFDMPFIRDFAYIKHHYGHNLKWNNDLVDFEKQLKKVETREAKNSTILEEKIKELTELRSKNKKNEKVEEDEVKLKKSRFSFLRMVNSLGKIGYKIDKMITTVEEFSLMIKQQFEEYDESLNRSNGR